MKAAVKPVAVTTVIAPRILR